MALIVSNKFFNHTSISFTQKLVDYMNNSPRTLYVYSGSMPASPEGFLPSNYTGQLLVTFTTPTYVLQSPDVIKFSSASAASATGTGTATWFANCSNTNGYVLLCDSIGVVGDQKVLILNTTSINSGNTITPLDFGLRFYQS